MSSSFAAHFLLPASANTGADFFKELLGGAAVQVIEGESWNALAYADLALAASGTVTVEAALLGTPMVTFYKVNPISWALGKALVKIPFFCMVNLIAERRVVPELMQEAMTGENLALQAAAILKDSDQMRMDLAEVRRKLEFGGSAISHAADEVMKVKGESVVQVC